MSLAGEWFQIEHVFSSAASAAKNADCGTSTNWELVEQSIRLGGLAAGCSLLENSGLKGKDDHTKVLFDIRNALIHNDGDISKNCKTTALTEAQDYLAKAKHNNLLAEPDQPLNKTYQPFFSLSGLKVQLESNILLAIGRCLP